jgi:hypothetical protein
MVGSRDVNSPVAIASSLKKLDELPAELVNEFDGAT